MSWIGFEDEYKSRWLSGIVPDSYYLPDFDFIPQAVVSAIYSYLPKQTKIFCFGRQPCAEYECYSFEKYLKK